MTTYGTPDPTTPTFMQACETTLLFQEARTRNLAAAGDAPVMVPAPITWSDRQVHPDDMTEAGSRSRHPAGKARPETWADQQVCPDDAA